ncbi:MAG: NTPase [Streptococcus salivarius]|jgi:hypothetical protein|nr:NTPase [Streptococcus salivarius]
MSKSFSDVPAHQDEFNIKNYIQGLAKFIMECETPLTIAIQGDWGTGKTSIMYQVEDKLMDYNQSTNSKNAKTIFFNTWQYSQFEMGNNLAVALITDLISELEVSESKKKDFFKKTRGAFSKGIEYLNMDIGILNGEKITEKVQEYLNSFEEKSDNIKNLKNNLQSVIDEAIENNNYDRIVIFIDDLDRLIPEKAIELLEILKLFLDCQHCVFVLAIDYNVVIRGTKGKYGDDLDDDKGKAFFEKIIQVPFTVPIANYDLENYINTSLKRINFSFDDSTRSNVTQLIKNSIGSNPRSINRLFNSVSLLTYIDNSRSIKSHEQALLIAIVCFQLRFEDAYNYILHSLNNCSDDIEDTEDYLIDLLENTFELQQNADYNALLSINGEFTLKNKQDKLDFRNFYSNLKVLLESKSTQLERDKFQKLIEKMTLSNTVAIGNSDSVISSKIVQNHKPNEDVQYVIRKLFNNLVVEDHFNLAKPKEFGKEKTINRDLPLPDGFSGIPNEFNRIKITRGKGQGINIYSSHNQFNSVYTSGDSHGQMYNDGIAININKKQVKKININKNKFLASELRNNPEKFLEFETNFREHVKELISEASKHL